MMLFLTGVEPDIGYKLLRHSPFYTRAARAL